MKNIIILLSLSILCLSACIHEKKPDPAQQFVIDISKQIAEQKIMEAKMKEHLDAVTNRDLVIMESTLTPNGNMQLILPGSEIIQSNAGFMDYHREWFADTTTVWTFETKILNSKASPQQGMSVVEVVYREPERDGKPYFNRMIVSYDLEKVGDNWYLIKDHASSVEKSTDKK